MTFVPPHNPRERECIGTIDGWELRQFSPADPKYGYFAARGFLHLQLWHPEAGVSVLTPSRLTAQRWEMFPVKAWKRPFENYRDFSNLVSTHFGIEAPDYGALREAMRSLVEQVEQLAQAGHSGFVAEQPTARRH